MLSQMLLAILELEEKRVPFASCAGRKAPRQGPFRKALSLSPVPLQGCRRNSQGTVGVEASSCYQGIRHGPEKPRQRADFGTLSKAKRNRGDTPKK